VFVEDGQQVYPPQEDQSLHANALQIFTGTAIFEQHGSDGPPLRGVVRIRLRFQLKDDVKYIGSATVAALASVSAVDDDRSLWGADAAQVFTRPDIGGRDPNGLPENELYLYIYAAVYGPDTALLRLAYQANVLLLDTTPALDSILVRPAGSGIPFMPSCTVQPGQAWEYQLTLTGPVTDPPFRADVGSDNAEVPVGPPDHQIFGFGQQTGSWTAPAPIGLGDVVLCTITATGGRATKTATVSVRSLH
jgi:hypothetical protein